MADKNTPVENLDTPVNSNEESTQNTTNNQTQQTPEVVPSVTKPRRQMPEWLHNITNFFKMLFVTPIVLLQNVFLRIAGGKDAVTKAQQEAADSLVQDDARRANAREGERMESEINNLLQARIKNNPEYTKDGLTITSLKVYQPEMGRDDIKHVFHVKCANNTQYGAAEYALYLDQNGQLRTTSIVPREIAIQLNELIKAVQLEVPNLSVDGGDPTEHDLNPDLDANGFNIDDTQRPAGNPVEFTSVINDELINNTLWTVEVERTNQTAYVNVTATDKSQTPPAVEHFKLRATFENGAICVPDIPDAAKEVIAQTVYQAYAPLMQQLVSDVSVDCGDNKEAAVNAVQQLSTSAMAARVYNATREIQDATSVKDGGTRTNMYITPQGENNIAVVTQNFNTAARKNENVVYLHAYHMDVSNPQNFRFQRDGEGKYAQSEDVTFKRNTPKLVVGADIAQWCYKATGISSLIMDEHTVSYTIEDKDTHALASVVNQSQHNGTAMRAQAPLTADQMSQILLQVGTESEITHPIKTTETAARVMSNSVNKSYVDYFVLGDTVMQYDGKQLQLSRLQGQTDEKGEQTIALRSQNYALSSLTAADLRNAYQDFTGEELADHDIDEQVFSEQEETI